MTVPRRLPRRGALRIGDRVRHDSQEHTVTGLSGTLVRLLADDGTESVLAVVYLQSADDFTVLSGRTRRRCPL